jgi:predicted DNA-binding transcriptional regulator YafY
LGLGYVEQRGDQVLTNAAASALAKIASILSSDAREALAAPIALTGPPHNAFPDNVVSLSRLREAIRSQRRLYIVYVDGRNSERTVWPIQLGFTDLARVLFAWCERKQAFRFFRTDRLVSAADGDRYPVRRVDLIRRCQDDMKIAEGAVQAPDRN